jgi:hypothetical protein
MLRCPSSTPSGWPTLSGWFDAALPTTGFLDNLFGAATDAAKLQTRALNVTKFYSARGTHILAATLTNLGEHAQGPSVGRVN